MTSNEVQLERKMIRLQRHVSLIEAVAVFLTKHPILASRCDLELLRGCVGLDFEEKAFIRPLGKDPIRLRLERRSEDQEDFAERTIYEDVSALSTFSFKWA